MFTFWRSTSLKIDSEKAVLKSHIFNFISCKNKSVKTADITKLEYVSAYTVNVADTLLAMRGISKLRYPPEVIIWAKNGKLTLKGNKYRSASEMKWLVYELALWLDMDVIYTQRQSQGTNK